MDTAVNGVVTPISTHTIGTDEHRIQAAGWILQNFDPTTQLFKKAVKVMEAYLAGKPLPKK